MPDIQLNSVESDGESSLTVKYTIKNASVKPFRIAAYESEDARFTPTNDTLASFVQISAAADLTPGVHTKVYKIGQQIKLPYAGVAATKTDYLLFVADDNRLVPEDDTDSFNQDNTTVFSGAYLDDKTLAIFGSPSQEPIRVELVNEGRTVKLHYPVQRSYSSSKIKQVFVQAGGGDDHVFAGTMTVPITAYGGAGKDTLTGGEADDILVGGDGDDRLFGLEGDDQMIGGSGDDQMFSGDGRNDLSGGSGDDQMFGGDGRDNLSGGSGSDVYVFESASSVELDSVYEEDDPGMDTLDFSKLPASTPVTVDLLATYQGREIAKHKNRTVEIRPEEIQWNFENVIGTPGNDVIVGNDADNRLQGLGGNDELRGNDGNDDLKGEAGDDTLYGGDGNDDLRGESGDDTLYGGAGNDSLRGESGNDTMDGGAGNDTLDGGDGNDSLFGNTGNDLMIGGIDSDVYYFGVASRLEHDTVNEKNEPGVDTLNFSKVPKSTSVSVSFDGKQKKLFGRRVSGVAGYVVASYDKLRVRVLVERDESRSDNVEIKNFENVVKN